VFWIMSQTWHDVLFAHWPVAPEAIGPYLPAGLDLDLYEGKAWVSLVPFGMDNVRFRGLIGLPTATQFPELNLRTYVKAGVGGPGTPTEPKPGVWFFSLDAASRLAVFGARRFFHLPYLNARMGMQVQDGEVDFHSERFDKRAAPASFTARYGPNGDPDQASPGSLDYWLTERYSLYTADAKGRLLRGDILHPPWSLQPAWAEITVNTLSNAAGFDLPDRAPLLHFSRGLQMRASPLQRT